MKETSELRSISFEDIRIRLGQRLVEVIWPKTALGLALIGVLFVCTPPSVISQPAKVVGVISVLSVMFLAAMALYACGYCSKTAQYEYISGCYRETEAAIADLEQQKKSVEEQVHQIRKEYGVADKVLAEQIKLYQAARKRLQVSIGTRDETKKRLLREAEDFFAANPEYNTQESKDDWMETLQRYFAEVDAQIKDLSDTLDEEGAKLDSVAISFKETDDELLRRHLAPTVEAIAEHQHTLNCFEAILDEHFA